MRWYDRYDLISYHKGMSHTIYLLENGRCQGVEFLHDFWRHLIRGIHREWTGRRETSTAGEGSPFAAIWSQDMDIMGLLDTCLLAVIVSGFVVILHQKHSKTLSTAFIWVVLVVSPRASHQKFSWQHFCSPKGTSFSNSATSPWCFVLPEIQLAEVRATELEAELKRQRLSQAGKNPWISRSREFFSDFFGGF